MPLVEKKTAPSTAPSYRPAVDMTRRAVGGVAAASSRHSCNLGDATGLIVEIASSGATWSMEHCHAIYPREIIAVDVISVPTAHVSLRGNDAIVLDLAGVWQQLDAGFFTTHMFPATKMQGVATTQIMAPALIAEEERTLDAAFARLVSYEPESEDDLDEREPTRQLRYRFPRR